MSGKWRVRRFAEITATAMMMAIAAHAGTVTLRDAAAASARQDIGIPVGSLAPAAALQKLDGTKVDLKDYYGKQPTLIEFWASWCENCEQLEPALKAAHTKYKDRIRFVGVSVTVNQSLARVKAYVEQHKLPLEMLWDAQGKATSAYEVPATSMIAIVKDGKVVYTGLGGDQNIDAALAKVLR